MVLFFQQLVNGIMLGSVYSLVALGLTLIYGILHVPNFAHGHKYMWAAFTSLFLVVNFHTNYWVSLVIAMVVMGLAGAGVERVVYRPLRDVPHINSFIAAIGLLLVLESLSRQIGMKVVYDGALPRQLVTLSFESSTPAQAVVRLLEGLGLNYAFGGDVSGKGVAVLLIASGSSSPTPPPTAVVPTTRWPPKALAPAAAPPAQGAAEAEPAEPEPPPDAGIADFTDAILEVEELDRERAKPEAGGAGTSQPASPPPPPAPPAPRPNDR